LQPITDQGIASKPSDGQPAVTTETIDPPQSKSSVTKFTYAAVTKPSPPQFVAGLLALRRQTLTDAWAEPASITSTNGETAPRPVKTARELMNEYAPADRGRSPGIWLWGAASQGDSI
jgi:hypothetical protein